MDFFKSILSDDPIPQVLENPQGSDPNSPVNPSRNHQEGGGDGDDDPDRGFPSHDKPDSNSVSADGGGGGGWSFGGLMKTFSTRSESVLETYRRDLVEFRSGLKKETELFREAASRAVKELPASIEVGASVAHGVLKSTAEIISHGKDTLLAPSDVEFDTSDARSNSNRSLDSRRYSRFDSQLRAIRSDVNTYCEEPEDLDDYNKWKLGFVLEDKSEEIENLIEENGAMEGIYKRIVPDEVDHNTFWCRYFYRVHKLKLQEDVRANLVKRAISIEDEEELTWDVEDDDDEINVASQGNALENKDLGNKDSPQIVKESLNDERQIAEKKSSVVSDNEGNAAEPSADDVSSEKMRVSEMSNDELVSKSDHKVGLDGKAEHGESGKDSDVSVVSTQPSMLEEEDLGWDEIEDLGTSFEKKVSPCGSPNHANVRKRLSAAEEDEDLSWDIEDDDEPVKDTK